MFIIIEYIIPNYDKVNVMLNKDGSPVILGSYHSAERFAKVNCNFNYKIMEL